MTRLANETVKKVALKFCGGCDPAYDRSEYWDRVKRAARGRIEWRRLDNPGFDAVLIINGCLTSCPEKEIDGQDCLILSLKNDETDPDQVVRVLLERGES